MSSPTLSPNPIPTVRDRLRGALWGLFVGDALAMPAHWYYDVAALRRDYGPIRDYQAPLEHHPNSIMSLASTGRAGRGSQEGEVVGGLILKGKKGYWGRPHTHYHRGMRPGDNTLNLLCVRVLLRRLTAAGGGDPVGFLRDYIDFMTAPDSHNDTYAESYHRDFFANYARGLPPERCAGAEGHDTASIGGLVSLPPVIFAAWAQQGRAQGRALCQAAVNEALLTQLRLTHRSQTLEGYALALGDLLLTLLEDPETRVDTLASDLARRLGFDAGKALAKVQREGLSDLAVIGGMLSPACYIDQSFPAVLYLAARYASDFEEALVANTNVGGDNCHRGAILGAILGTALGYAAIPPRWTLGLQAHADLETEIEGFLDRFLGSNQAGNEVPNHP